MRPVGPRLLLSGALVFVLVAGVLAALGGGGHLGPAYLLLAPSVVVLAATRGHDLAVRGLLALAVTIVVDVGVSELLLITGTWSLRAALLGVGCACSAIWLALGAVADRRAPLEDGAA